MLRINRYKEVSLRISGVLYVSDYRLLVTGRTLLRLFVIYTTQKVPSPGSKSLLQELILFFLLFPVIGY